MFKETIQKLFPVPKASLEEKLFEPTYEELSGIRYAAGWVVRSKTSKSTKPDKIDLLVCLGDLLDDDEDEFQESQEWIDTIDRGGLT